MSRETLFVQNSAYVTSCGSCWLESSICERNSRISFFAWTFTLSHGLLRSATTRVSPCVCGCSLWLLLSGSYRRVAPLRWRTVTASRALHHRDAHGEGHFSLKHALDIQVGDLCVGMRKAFGTFCDRKAHRVGQG